MIELIERKKIFQNPVLAYSIGSLQFSYQEHCLMESTTEEEVQQWVKYFEEICDCEEYDTSWQERYSDELILGLDEKNLTNYAPALIKKLSVFFTNCKVESLQFALEFKVDWFDSSIKEPRAQKEFQKFKNLIKKDTYSEAFLVEKSSFQDFLTIIFWIGHLANIPNIWFGNNEIPFVANISPEALVHFHFYNTQSIEEYKQMAQKSGFQIY